MKKPMVILGTLLVIFAIIVPVGLFVLGRFTVKGDSMSPTLRDGQKIWVNKLIIGARISYSDLRDTSRSIFVRVPGVRSLCVGDIAVFNYLYGWREGKIEFNPDYVYAKRCVACPGDSISIRNGFYWNSRKGVDIGVPYDSQYKMSVTPDSVLASWQIPVKAYSPCRSLGWTIKEFGPLYIPGIGDTLFLNRTASETYYRQIEYETGTRPVIKGDNLLIGQSEISRYVFTHNWYFFAGDNVLDSKDSRYIGLIPDDYIIGIIWNRECYQ